MPIVPSDAQLLWESPWDSGRRVYASGGVIYKIVLGHRQLTDRFRARDLSGERDILEHLEGIKGIPRSLGHTAYELGEVLAIERITGSASLAEARSLLRAVATLPQVVALIMRLCQRGVVHGDLTPENVLLDGRGGLWLIDFDQAHLTTPRRALVANFLGGRVGERRVETSMIGFAKRLLKRALPASAVAFVRRLKHGADAFDYRTVPPILPLPEGASDRLRTLHAAWLRGAESDANSPGAGVCYYGLEVEGFQLPGERPWSPRWSDFRRALDFRGARVLELGCNMGLLSTFALHDGGAVAAHGVDIDKRILEANRLVQQGFGVSFTTQQLSFDDAARWEDQLAAFKPTIVTALSVLNWIKDKQRFIDFLGRFDTVLFEGHEPAEVEGARLRGAGFRTVDLVSMSERGRPVLLARK